MWNGFDEEVFLFNERKGRIIFPKQNPNGKVILKTEYLNALVGPKATPGFTGGQKSF